VEAFAAASSNCNEAVAAAMAANTKTAIATAVADSYAGACSTGGTASATSEVVATAVATATASAYVEALAAVSGPCGGCGASKPAAKPKTKASPPAAEPAPKAAPHDHGDERHTGEEDDEDLGTDDFGEGSSHDDDAPRTTTSNNWHSTHEARKYKACRSWLRDDCCNGYKGTNSCHCWNFSLRWDT
jgi:hypothetical protein